MTPVRESKSYGSPTPFHSPTLPTGLAEGASGQSRATESFRSWLSETEKLLGLAARKLARIEAENRKKNMSIYDAIDLLSEAKEVEDIEVIGSNQLGQLNKLLRRVGLNYFKAIRELHDYALKYSKQNEKIEKMCKELMRVVKIHKIQLETELFGKATHEGVWEGYKVLREIKQYAYSAGMDLFTMYPEIKDFEAFEVFIEKIRSLQLSEPEVTEKTLMVHQNILCSEIIEVIKWKDAELRESALNVMNDNMENDIPDFFWDYKKMCAKQLRHVRGYILLPGIDTFSLEHSFKLQQSVLEFVRVVRHWQK